MRIISLLTIVFLLVISLFGCSHTSEIVSSWNDQQLVIDGNDEDWRVSEDTKAFYAEDEKLLIEIKNDKEYLYISLITSDRENQVNIMSRGLTVWFDREGGSEKKIGIKFPIGILESDEFKQFRQFGEGKNDSLIGMFKREQTEAEVNIPSENETTRINLLKPIGIKAKISETGGRMVYELKIALHTNEDNLYAIGVKDLNSKIGIGFETSEINKEKLRDEGMRGNMGSMDREKINERMKEGGRNIGMMKGSMPKSLKYWINVQLATGK